MFIATPEKVRLSLVLFLLSSVLVSAQGENNNWVFGNKSGITFNSGSPEFFSSNIYSKEGAASISDAFGNLLFYTSGNMVWDREHQEMPNGNILGNGWMGSGTQAALILKSLSDPNQYYVFTLDPQEVALSSNPRLRYSIVDMTLNGGLGDVHPTLRDIVLDDEMEERMVAVESNDCGYWIVGHKRHSNKYVSFKLTAEGITGPIYSEGTLQGNFIGSDPGEIKISPDGSKIAIVFHNVNIENIWDLFWGGMEIGDFDKNTGLISNTSVLYNNKIMLGYGLSFSPDNSKLYATLLAYDLAINQYDLSLLPDVEALIEERIAIYHKDTIDLNFDNLKGMRLGPDSMIYVVWDSGYVCRIENPNSSGDDCGFNKYAVDIPYENGLSALGTGPGSDFYGFVLGNNTVTVHYTDTLRGSNDTIKVCFRDSFLLQVDHNLLNYTWNDGTMGHRKWVYESGTYYCISSELCTIRRDTFTVDFVKGNYQLGNDTAICPGDSLVLEVSGNGFVWQDGSTDSWYMVTESGRYIVTINEGGCFYSDTVQVTVYEGNVHIRPGDTIICEGDMILLSASADPPAESYLWSTGQYGSELEVREEGAYAVAADTRCGILTDTSSVRVQDCDCNPLLPTAFSPNADGLNDVFGPLMDCFPLSYELYIYNRFGERVFVSYDIDQAWNGTYNNTLCDIGVYFYFLRYTKPNGIKIEDKGDIHLVR